jgi:hypothetical protein
MSPLYLHNSSPDIEILSRQSNHLPLEVALMPLLVPIIVSQNDYTCPALFMPIICTRVTVNLWMSKVTLS